MKKIFVLLFVLSNVILNAQNTATVKRFKGVPVFVYCEPVVNYKVLKTYNMPLYAAEPLKEKLSFMVQNANRLKKKGKISDFDAIVYDDANNSGMIVKLDSFNLTANVQRYKGIPVYVYSEPTKNYTIQKTYNLTLYVAEIEKTKLNFLVQNANRLNKKGKIDGFDAIIIDDNSNSGLIIKYNQ